MNGPVLSVRSLDVGYAPGETVFRGLNLEIAAGEIVCLIGASGSGKTTLLNTVAGFLKPTGGTAVLAGSQRLGYIFQSDALLPWRTVRANLALGPELAGKKLTEADALDYLRLFNLEAAILDSYPASLSGGMRQRVAIIQALLTDPDLLLLDEPGRPYILAIGSLPMFALAPVMIVWFGIGFFSKVMMAALSTVVIAFVQAAQGAGEIEERYVRLFQVMHASRRAVFVKLVMPSALVWVVNSMKLNIGFALMGAFIGEFVASQAGLGHMIVRAAGLFDMAKVFAGCFVLMLLALALGVAVGWLERRLLRWKYV